MTAEPMATEQLEAIFPGWKDMPESWKYRALENRIAERREEFGRAGRDTEESHRLAEEIWRLDDARRCLDPDYAWIRKWMASLGPAVGKRGPCG